MLGDMKNRVVAYRYRWVVLASMVVLLFSVEIQWMTLSPIGRSANAYFSTAWNPPTVSFVDLLSFIYMAGFVVFALPSSFIIKKGGVVRSVYIAAFIICVASVLKAALPHSPSMIIAAQILFSFSQAIVLNMETATVATWFPIRERGMAMGILSSFLFIALSFNMVFSPYLMSDSAMRSIPRIFLIYGGISFAGAIISAVFIREQPPTPSSFVEPASTTYLKAFSRVEKQNSLKGIILIFSISWGVLMAMLVKIDLIASQMKVSSTAFFGLTMLLSGAVGAVVIPALSDHFRKRKFFYVLCGGCSLPGLVMMMFANNETLAYAGAGVFGFFAFCTIPIGEQYAAELGHEIPEEIVQVWMSLFSQAVGALIILITMFSAVYLDNLIIFFIGLLVASFIGMTFLSESKVIVTEEERLDKEINREIVQDE